VWEIRVSGRVLSVCQQASERAGVCGDGVLSDMTALHWMYLSSSHCPVLTNPAMSKVKPCLRVAPFRFARTFHFAPQQIKLAATRV
jgi:hypothetical protein